MSRPMFDMLMRRPRMDGRNPYGSKGGYVTSYDPRHRDMARGRRNRMDGLMMDDMRRYHEGKSEYSLGEMTQQRQPMRHDPYTPYGYYDERRMPRRDGHDVYPVEFMGAVGMPSSYETRRPMRDYAGDYGDRLTRDELHRWAQDLLAEVEEKDRGIFSKENILKKARDLGIKFDEVNEDEFYVTTLMMLTDYSKTLGTANVDLYLKLAKDWLWDDDVDIRYGEKLAVYYDTVVCGE